MTQPSFMSSLNGRVNALHETGIVEVAQYGWDRPDLIRFWFGEGDVQTPAFICQAASDAMFAGETFYTDQRGIRPLRDALAAYMTRTFRLPIGEERITLTTSGMGGLDLIMMMLLDPGDEVVIVGPVWPNIFSTVFLNQGTVRHASVRLTADDWVLDLDDLFAQVTDRTKAIFVNSPNNPTGWMMEADQQKALMDFARARGIWVVADEVYHQLVFDREVAPSFLNVAEPEDRLLVVNSFSKSWLMTGWRLGWITHPAGLGETLAKLVQITTSGAPQFLHRGGIAALEQGDHVIADLKARCKAGRDITFDRLESWPRIRAVRPKAAFYAFFAVDGMTDSVAYCKALIDGANVGLAPGSAFGPGGEGYIRLCFAAEAATLRRGLDRLAPMLGAGTDQAA